MNIQNFIAEFKKTFIYDMLCESIEDEQLFEHTVVGDKVIWFKAQTNQMWSMWQAAKATPLHQTYFSHDFNGDGFKYHNTLDEAQKEALANLEWYQERVADGHHVNEDGNFNELCYGVVIESAGYSVEDIVTEKHHSNDEYTQYEIGTEILSLGLYKAIIEAAEGK